MSRGDKSNRLSMEICVGAATVVCSTAAYLLGSTNLAVVALVIGGISFGLLLRVDD